MGIIKYFQSTQSNKFTISLQYPKGEVRDGVNISHVDTHQSFYKLAFSFLIEVARHVESTQNRKMAIFLQYLKKGIIDKVYFLHADKHKSFLQVDTNILGVFGQT